MSASRRPVSIALLAWMLFVPGSVLSAEEDRFTAERRRMVEEQLSAGWGRTPVRNPAVLDAMRTVPRHEFVLPELRHVAYGDHPLRIHAGQTISQPYIVALMTELADIQPGERVLEIGTGSGYQAAILASLTDAVYSIEIVESLARSAAETLDRLGYAVRVRAGDGYQGWPEAAPFDAIIVTAAAPRIPQPLIDQLADGGRLVIPMGDQQQELYVFIRSGAEVTRQAVIPVRFVPMVGEVRTPLFN